MRHLDRRGRSADHLRSGGAERRAAAGALARLGVGAGDPVGTFCWNNAEHLEAYFGVPAMGAVLHTLNMAFA